jgi:hypothetical protein
MKNQFTKALTLFLSAAMIAAAAPGVGVLSPITVMAEETKTSIKNASITGDFNGLVYNGNAQEPDYTVTLNGKTLVKGTDYTEAWANTTDAGTATLTITGTGDYKDTATKTFTIAKATPVVKQMVGSSATSDTTKRVDYNGSSKSFDYKVYGPDGTDLTSALSSITTLTYTNGGKTEASPTKPGTYAVTIKVDPSTDETLKKNYNSVTYNGSLVINKIDLSGYTLSLDNGSDYTYNASAIKPTFKLKKPDGRVDSTAKEGTDYTVSYPNAVNVGGPYTITVTGKGDYYAGSVSAGFYIKASTTTTGYNFAERTVSGDTEAHYITFDPTTIPDQQWTGKEITPTVKLTHHWTDASDKAQKEELKQGTDYTVTYEDNKDIGNNTAKAIFTGKGKFKTTKITKTFSIVKKDVSDKTISVSLSPTSYPYTGKSITPKLTVRDTTSGRTLTAGSDYTLSYPDSNNTNAGNYIRVSINGAGNYYSGSVEKTFQITKHTISASEFTIDPEVVTVTGTGTSASITPQTVKIAYTQSGDSRLTTADITQDTTSGNTDGINGPASFDVSYKNNTAAGNATVTITGKNNYSGTVIKTFKIIVENPNAKDLTAQQNGKPLTVISDIAAQTYTGNQLRPSVTVRYNGVTLGSNDYELSYGANNAAGTGSVTVTGKNNYKGSVTKSFTINPANISVASIAGIPSQAYTGGQITPALTITHNGSTLREGTDYRAYYSNNINKGTATVRIQGLKNFTGEVTRTFSIVDKKDLDKEIYATSFTLPEEVTVTAGGTVSITASITPSNANKYSIRWSTGSASFPFSDGLTAETKENTPSIEVKGGKEGSAVITATLYGENNKEIGTAYTLVKIEKRFDDVSTSTYYSTAVDALANYGYTTGSGASREFHATPVVNGNTTTTYNPAGPVTRGQFVTMMYNKALADYKAGKSTTDPSKAAASGFSDVDSASYYASAVNWASANGIAQGTSASTFNPNGTVTRAEAVTFLQRWLGGAASTSSQFSDVASSSYYAGAVGWAVNNGVTNGTSATTFEPGTKCNRGQAATFIYRAAF